MWLADHSTPAKGILHCKLEYHEDGYSEAVDSITVQRFFGNKHGKLDKAVSAGGVYTRTYDENGYLISFTDPLQATTTWERDVRGRELKMIDPLGRVTVIERDPDGHIRTIIDPMGGVTELSRTGDSLTWKDPLDAVFHVAIDQRGLTKETIAPNGARTVYRYDAHGNLIEQIDAAGAIFRLTYDFLGRCTSISDPTGAVTSYAYSDRGDLIAIRDPEGGVTRYGYDGTASLTSITLPGGQTTTFVRGGLNRLCQINRPNGAMISFKYDREGRLVEVHNAEGEVHALELNAAGLVVRERAFDGRVLAYGYDLAGRLRYAVNGAGEKTELVYDLAGQLLERNYADGRSDVFGYNLRGELISATGAGGEFLFERNAVGWVIKETQVVRGEAHTIEVTYDLMGNPVRRETSLGHAAEWTRDARGCGVQLVLDGNHAIQMNHDALGREIGRLLPGGGRIEKAYDSLGHLVRQRVLAPTRAVAVGAGEPDWIGPRRDGVTSDQAFRYNAASELVEAWDQAHGVKRFEYDPAGQLLAMVPEGARGELFRYDSAGNVFGDEARVYGPGNRLLRKGDTEYGWDADGRLVERRAREPSGAERITRYRWRSDGLLGAIENPDGSMAEFQYDPFARRIEKRISCRDPATPARRLVSTTRFVWDGASIVHEIKRSARDAGDPMVEERTYYFEEGGEVPAAHRESRASGAERAEGDWIHYVNDHLGAPQRLVTPSGEVAGELLRTAWGKVLSPSGPVLTPLRFLGQYEDEETGLSYNRYRYYDPDTGRYISADPIGIHGGFNGFDYAGNSPTSQVDPNGLMPYSVIRDPQGRIVHVADSATGLPGGTQRSLNPALQGGTSRQSCSEVAALNQMAGTMTGSPQQVRDQMRQRFQEGWTIETRTGRAPPDARNGGALTGQQMAPCPSCAQLMRNLGIHPCNLDNNRPADTPPQPPIRGVLGPNRLDRDARPDNMGRPPRWQGDITQGNEGFNGRRRGDPTTEPNIPGWTNHG